MSQQVDSDNIYALSDEELMQMDLESLTPPQKVVEPEVGNEVPNTNVDTSDTTEVPEPEVEVPDPQAGNTQETPTVDTSTTEDAKEGQVPQAEEIDYKGFYEALTKPFVANGKEVQVTNPEDITRLMQQGAGFHKKMEALKPMRRINKLLEDNNLLDENQLNYLIDIHNKKPEAIAKLIKDTGIDLYEFDVEQGDNYVPQQRAVSEESTILQEVLDDLKLNSPTYDETINVLGNLWDAPSRQVLAQHPELIRIIDSQVQDGTYAKISQAVEYQRMLGNLRGVSDIQAYKQVGEMIFGTGQQQQAPQPQAQQPLTQPRPAVPQQQPVASTQPNNSADQRRKAAAAPRSNTSAPKPAIDYYALSDEELLKVVG